MPPSDAEAKIPCPTPQHLQAELENLALILALGDKEDTWEKLERAVIRFAGVTRGGGYKHLAQYVEGVGRKGVGPQLAACMLSDRGRLSGVAIELLQTLAPRLGNSFLPLVSLYLEALVKLLGRPNKVFLKRAEKCLITVVSHCQLPSILPELRRGLSDDAATCRRGCAGGLDRVAREWTREIITEKGVVILEEALRKMATDKDPEVRQISKRVWARFREVWPERVDDFSAPLTPTIRRYLDIPSAAGGSSKPKAPARPVAPPIHRPVSAAAPESSSTTVQSTKPVHQRAQALNTRPARPDFPPNDTAEAGPPTKRLSPRKDAEEVVLVPSDPTKLEIYRPPLPKSASVGPGQLCDPPVALGRHGRSVSHNILSSASMSISGPSSPSEPIRTNPLSKPSRPHLPASLSSISLPADPLDTVRSQAPRRFAPPTRIVRPAPLPSTEEVDINEAPTDYSLHTPSGNTVLCGPQRLAPGGQSDRWVAVGLGKRPVALGPAQRRAVTAPAGTAEGVAMALQTPGLGNRVLGRSVKDPIPEMEEPKELEAFPFPNQADLTAVPAQPLQVPQHVDSPLMPVLARSAGTTTASSASSSTAVDDPSEDLLKVEQEEVDLTVMVVGGPIVAEEAGCLSSTEPDGLLATEAQDLNDNAVVTPITLLEKDLPHQLPKDEEEHPNAATGLASSQSGERNRVVEEVQPAHPAHSTDLTVPNHSASVAFESHFIHKTAVEAKANIVVGTPLAELFVDIPEQQAPIPAVQVEPILDQGAKVPPVPKPEPASSDPRKAAPAAKPRTISGPVDRKPFRPTARPVVGLSAPVKQPSNALFMAKGPGLTASSSTRPTAAPVPVPSKLKPNRPAEQPTATLAPFTTAEGKSEPPQMLVTKAAIPAGNDLSKPTASTAAKAAAKLDHPKLTTKPTVRPTKSVHAQATLPPVRKEKVRLKAPLPSFVPTRGKAKVGLKASTSTDKGGEPRTIVAKVRPEAIPLPLSPAEKARLAPADIPLPRSPISATSTGSVKEDDRSSHPSVRSSLSVPNNLQPLPPLPNTHASSAAESPPRFPPGVLVQISSSLNSIGLPIEIFHSASSRYASTAPPASSDGETEDEDLTGITFKPATTTVRPRVRSDQITSSADLIELSAPSRPVPLSRSDGWTPAKSAEGVFSKLIGGSTPGGTPGSGRIALAARDVNL